MLTAITIAGCSRDPVAAARRHADRGDRYVQQQKFADAVIEYRAAIQTDPRNGEIRRRLADAYDRSADPLNAYHEYVRAADLLPNNADVQIKAGIFLLAAGRFEDAQTRARKALSVSTRNVEALLLLGQSLAGLKDLNGARTRIEEALRIDPDRPNTYASLGQMELAQGNVSRAEAAFASAVSAAPNSVDANLAMGDFYFAAGKREQSEKWYKKALALSPKDSRTNRALAIYYLATNRPAEAEVPLKAAADSGKPQSRLVLADYYYGIGKAADARRVLESLTNETAMFAEVRLRLAVLDFAAANHAEAYKKIDAVLGKQPQDLFALILKGRFLLADDKLDAAKPLLTKAVDRAPNSASAHYWLGTAYGSENQLDDAVRELRRTLEIEPKYVDALVQLAALNLQRGAAAAAVTFADQAASMRPDDPKTRAMLVKALLARGELRRANAEAIALRKFPDSIDAQIVLGLAAAANHDLADARQIFERALKTAPDSIDALSGLVGVSIALGRVGDADAAVQAQLKTHPDDAKVLRLAAQVYQAQGDRGLQERTLRKVITIEPGNLGAYADLAHLFLDQGKLEETRREYEAILAHDPKNVPVMTVTALMLQIQGRRTDAIKRYEDVLASDPHAGFAANNLAMMYAEDGHNLDVALQLAQTATAALPSAPQVHDTLGWIYYLKGLPSLAIPPLELSAKTDPSSPVTQYHLGLAYAKAGQKVKARSALEQALKISKSFEGADDARRVLATLRS
jgi:tetratricopeptide (TPR) repeat protein